MLIILRITLALLLGISFGFWARNYYAGWFAYNVGFITLNLIPDRYFVSPE